MLKQYLLSNYDCKQKIQLCPAIMEEASYPMYKPASRPD